MEMREGSETKRTMVEFSIIEDPVDETVAGRGTDRSGKGLTSAIPDGKPRTGRRYALLYAASCHQGHVVASPEVDIPNRIVGAITHPHSHPA